MQNVIITGADGFVGSNTVAYFIEHGVHVLAIDRNERPVRLQENELLEYQQADIFWLEELKNRIPKEEYDAWIHFAWAGSAGEARQDYELQMKNALNCVQCVRLAADIGCKRFVGAGSIMEKEVLAVMEQQGSKPGRAYAYGVGKLTAHYLCKAFAHGVGVELIWPLITNAYGVGERSPRFINTTISKILRNEELQFTAGTQNYDFVYVEDVAKAFYLCAEKGKDSFEYIVGSGDAKPLKEFVMEMLQTFDRKINYNFGTKAYSGVNLPVNAFCIKQLKEDTGYQAEIPFKEGVRRTREWMSNE